MENWNRRLPSTSMSRILLSFWMRRSNISSDQVNQGSEEGSWVLSRCLHPGAANTGQLKVSSDSGSLHHRQPEERRTRSQTNKAGLYYGSIACSSNHNQFCHSIQVGKSLPIILTFPAPIRWKIIPQSDISINL